MAPGRIVYFHCPVQDKIKPAIVVDVHSDDCVNLQVFDGNETHLETSVTLGEGPGNWNWPPRKPPPET